MTLRSASVRNATHRITRDEQRSARRRRTSTTACIQSGRNDSHRLRRIEHCRSCRCASRPLRAHRAFPAAALDRRTIASTCVDRHVARHGAAPQRQLRLRACAPTASARTPALVAELACAARRVTSSELAYSKPGRLEQVAEHAQHLPARTRFARRRRPRPARSASGLRRLT